MKHPLKIAGALLGAAFLLGASVLPVSAAREFPELNSYCTVYDIEDAISADEEKMAAQRIQETLRKNRYVRCCVHCR